MSVEILSRIQFALTISFHFLFPPMSIGLGLVLVIMQGMRLRTGDPLYTNMARFWTRVFGLIFAMGVATGIPMEFQFGTNWAHYARFVGDIFGSPLAIEGIYAFFLESGFLALLLFGWNKIGPRMHFVSTVIVAVGTHFSALWILVANSWMQTPAGYHLARQVKVTASGEQFPMSADLGGVAFTLKEIPLPAGYVVQPGDLGQVRAVVDNFREAIFNPSTLDRLGHTIFACWIIGAFLVAGVSAWWLLRGKNVESARASLKISLVVATVACLLQMVAGDATARGVAKNQPTKLAAIEGLMHSQKDAPLGVVGWAEWQRDANGEIVGVENHAVHIPGMLSVLVSGEFLNPEKAAETTVKGLEELPTDELLRARHPGATDAEIAKLRPKYWPNVPVIFQTYHLMVAIGITLTGLCLVGCVTWWRGWLWKCDIKAIRYFLFLLVASPFLAQLATQAGWFTTEMGRQPWIVYEVLKTNEAVSAVVRAPQVMRSIILFAIIYLLLTALFGMMLLRLIRKGPEPVEAAAGVEKWHPLSLRSGRQTQQ